MTNKLNCVLLVDDDEPTNFLNKLVLKKADCAEHVVAVQSGSAALDFLTSDFQGKGYPKPDLIFLDLNMPGMTGWEFLEKYKELDEEIQGKVVIVILTTSLNPDDEERATEMPEIDGFRNKPLNKDTILDIIKTHFPEID